MSFEETSLPVSRSRFCRSRSTNRKGADWKCSISFLFVAVVAASPALTAPQFGALPSTRHERLQGRRVKKPRTPQQARFTPSNQSSSPRSFIFNELFQVRVEQITGTFSRGREEATIEPINQSNENGASEPNTLSATFVFFS